MKVKKRDDESGRKSSMRVVMSVRKIRKVKKDDLNRRKSNMKEAMNERKNMKVEKKTIRIDKKERLKI